MAGNCKRVRSLYRVSKKKQTDKEDIPMQRKACREFAERMPGWVIEKEYLEKGVSGYHISAEDRDVLREIKRDALNREFDILLVFMFDRIGRREDETPFVVEWLVAQGIEVWSVKEGQQKIESRTDKLINFMRYWQSGGESEKTSIRVAEKHRQMVEDGEFRGGPPPFGYTLRRSGKVNRRGYGTHELVIEEGEAQVVREIFELYVKKGYGAVRIAGALTEKGYRTRNGGYFSPPYIIALMKNPIYVGDYISGKRKSTRGSKKRMAQKDWIHSRDIQEHLVIVAQKDWDKAAEIRKGRTSGNTKECVPFQTKSFLLYAGLARCGHCGLKLIANTKQKSWLRKSDRKEIVYTTYNYRCTKRSAQNPCDGQAIYSRAKLDAIITPPITAHIKLLSKTDVAPVIQKLKERLTAAHAKSLAAVKKQRESAERDLFDYRAIILKAVRGESRFRQEDIASAMDGLRDVLSDLDVREQSLREEISKQEAKIDSLVYLQNIVPDWAQEFNNADTDVKKMAVTEIVDAIYVYRDRVKIKFKANLFRESGEDTEAGTLPVPCKYADAERQRRPADAKAGLQGVYCQYAGMGQP